jgi:hypothetical protein
MGFGVPLDIWFRGPLLEMLHDHLTAERFLGAASSRRILLNNLLDEHRTGRRNHVTDFESLLMLEMWFREIEKPATAAWDTKRNCGPSLKFASGCARRRPTRGCSFVLRAFAPILRTVRDSSAFPILPRTADAIRNTSGAIELLALADEILAQSDALVWLHDRYRAGHAVAVAIPIGGCETAPNYFRRIPFLDTSRAGDHKIIWELNRHQHLVVLAQCLSIERTRRLPA